MPFDKIEHKAELYLQQHIYLSEGYGKGHLQANWQPQPPLQPQKGRFSTNAAPQERVSKSCDINSLVHYFTPVATLRGHAVHGLLPNCSACTGFLEPVLSTSSLEKEGAPM